MAEPSIDNRAYYDRFAETYEAERHGGYHKLIDELETELVLPFAEGRDVLEVGCGTGLILARTAAVAKSHVGIDISEGMLAHAEARGLDVQVASATALPFDDASFDLTYSFKVLSHVRELETALAEMARVTRPGGRVFIELYNRDSVRYLIRRARGGASIGGGLDDDQVFFRFYRPAEMRAALPPSLRLVQQHGVRVWTTLPSMLRWPVVGSLLRRAEVESTRGALARLGARVGGFLILECVKRVEIAPRLR